MAPALVNLPKLRPRQTVALQTVVGVLDLQARSAEEPQFGLAPVSDRQPEVVEPPVLMHEARTLDPERGRPRRCSFDAPDAERFGIDPDAPPEHVLAGRARLNAENERTRIVVEPDPREGIVAAADFHAVALAGPAAIGFRGENGFNNQLLDYLGSAPLGHAGHLAGRGLKAELRAHLGVLVHAGIVGDVSADALVPRQ